MKTGAFFGLIAWLLAQSALLAVVPTTTADAASLELALGLLDGQKGAEVGRPATIQLNVSAGGDDGASPATPLTAAVYVIQVIDPDGFTGRLVAGSVELEGDSAAGRALGSSWVPEKEGRHSVQAFLVNPAWSALLAEPALAPVDVATTHGPTMPVCLGSASCISGVVTKVVDGDTLDVGKKRVRLALVDTPERGEPGYGEAKAFTASLCPAGSPALVDEDDGQTRGSYGRMVAVVYCGGALVNEQLLESGHAVLYKSFCSQSEFASEPWARKAGC